MISSSKILKFNKLNTVIKKIKNENKIIVLCHGVFDLLNNCNVKYFKEAKSMGDILVVVITPDRFLKNTACHSNFNEDLRTETIAAIDVVDYVAINEWPTAVETINLLKPDLYVKGLNSKDSEENLTNYIQQEEDTVRSVGGKVVFSPDFEVNSSFPVKQKTYLLTDEQKNLLDLLKTKITPEKIFEDLDKLANLKILLVGEVIIDKYVFCDSIGKSGKDPVLTNKIINTEKYTGGILSVANQISDFCKGGKILSYLGDRNDQFHFIKENLSSNIELDSILKLNSPTILKTRFVDNYTKTKLLGVYDINDDLLNENEETEFCTKLEDCIGEYDVVIVVDYGHGLITDKIITLLEEKSKYLAVNTQLNSFNVGFHTISKYNNADYVCVHEGELRHDYRNRSDTVKQLVQRLYDRIKSNIIVITQGKEGSLAFKNGEFITCPAYAEVVVDRVGSGDALLAITSLCFAAGIQTELALFIGNLAAGEMVAKIGTGNKLKKDKLLEDIDSLLKYI